MSKMISIMIEVLIFAAIIGIISYNVATANVTGATKTIVGLITLVVAAGFMYYIAKQFGLGGK
jgi:hypothetical protein